MQDEFAKAARLMARKALKGALATTDADTGGPYASMILLATTVDGSPVTLISRLARHTRNLTRSSAASILIDTSNHSGDPTTGGRLSLMGRFGKDSSAPVRSRFLMRQPQAASYADFADFEFWRLEIDSAHFIEGFGRIVTLPGAAMRVALEDAAEFSIAEAAHMPALRQRWPALTGFDSEGVDLLIAAQPGRMTFDHIAPNFATAQVVAAKCLGRLPPA